MGAVNASILKNECFNKYQKKDDIQLKSEKEKIAKKLKIVLGAVLIVIIGFFFMLNWEGQIDYEAIVRAYRPFGVTQGLDYTCGEVFDKYIEEPEWKVRERDDTNYVDIWGKAKGIDRELAITISIILDEENQDDAIIAPESVNINGVIFPTQNDAVEFLFGMFWMYDEGYDDISELFSGGDYVSSMEDKELEVYDSIINLYTIALKEGWNTWKLEDAGVNYLCGYYSDESELGYAYLDIDHNGTTELLIGDTTEYGGISGCFFDLYTLVNNEPVLVASSGERDRYYLCVDGFIANEDSGSIEQSVYSYYWIQSDGSMKLSERVIYDSFYDNENPWFYSIIDSSFESIDYSPISYEVAQQLVSKHAYAEIVFTPFSSREGLENEAVIDEVAKRDITNKIEDIYYGDMLVCQFLGMSIERIIDEWGNPLEVSEGGGVNYCIYDGIAFAFDADKIVYNVELSPSMCSVDGNLLCMDRAGLIEVLGTPTEEGWDYYDNEVYCLWYEGRDGEINLRVELLSPDDIAYGIWVW